MFDKEGNMRQWWSNKTITEYINRTDCFIQQYNNYYLPEVNDHVNNLKYFRNIYVNTPHFFGFTKQVNGELTLGENIADNGGLREAFNGYQLHVRKYGKESRLPGFEKYTHNQLFFMSFGNVSYPY